jgi:hypothetical protein
MLWGGMSVFEDWHHPLCKHAILCIIGEKGKQRMDRGTKKKSASGSFVDLKRNLYPSKPGTDLK